MTETDEPKNRSERRARNRKVKGGSPIRVTVSYGNDSWGRQWERQMKKDRELSKIGTYERRER